MNEFQYALSTTKSKSATCLDGVTADMIKFLGPVAQEVLLILFNGMLLQSSFPTSWLYTRVLAFSKPGGKGFRPIALTSVVSKLFEKLIQCRMEHKVERRGLIPSFQFGFRKRRSAVDCVASFVTDTQIGFMDVESTLAISIDIKGAFNVRPLILNGFWRIRSESLWYKGSLGRSSVTSIIQPLLKGPWIIPSTEHEGGHVCGRPFNLYQIYYHWKFWYT